MARGPSKPWCVSNVSKSIRVFCRMRLAKAMSLAHMRFGENPDPATPAEKVWVCGGLSRYVEMATKLHIEESVARMIHSFCAGGYFSKCLW